MGNKYIPLISSVKKRALPRTITITDQFSLLTFHFSSTCVKPFSRRRNALVVWLLVLPTIAEPSTFNNILKVVSNEKKNAVYAISCIKLLEILRTESRL